MQRDVVIYNSEFPTFMLNTDALRYLDKRTTGDIPMRRKITSILSRIMSVLNELKAVKNKGLAKSLFAMWWEKRQDELWASIDNRVYENIANHVNAMARHCFKVN